MLSNLVKVTLLARDGGAGIRIQVMLKFLSWRSGWRIQLRTMGLRVQSLALLSGLRIRRCRCGSDLTLLWLWRRPVAMALIRPLAWKPPYAAGVALEKAKRPKTIKQKKC